MSTLTNPLLDLPAEAYQTLLARIDIFNESIFYTRYRGNDPVSSFEVSPVSLAAAFSGMPLTTSLLPPGAIFLSRMAHFDHIALYLPPTIRKLKSSWRKKPYRIPTPPLVFVGKGQAYSIYALQKPYCADPGQSLYHAPFPNVHLQGFGFPGHICPGNVEFPVSSRSTILEAVKLFFDSDFNMHLVQSKSREFPDSIRKLWTRLDQTKAKTFPLDDLVYMRKTVKDLFELF
jgi:hypothetical protein